MVLWLYCTYFTKGYLLLFTSQSLSLLSSNLAPKQKGSNFKANSHFFKATSLQYHIFSLIKSFTTQQFNTCITFDIFCILFQSFNCSKMANLAQFEWSYIQIQGFHIAKLSVCLLPLHLCLPCFFSNLFCSNHDKCKTQFAGHIMFLYL